MFEKINKLLEYGKKSDFSYPLKVASVLCALKEKEIPEIEKNKEKILLLAKAIVLMERPGTPGQINYENVRQRALPTWQALVKIAHLLEDDEFLLQCFCLTANADLRKPKNEIIEHLKMFNSVYLKIYGSSPCSAQQVKWLGNYYGQMLSQAYSLQFEYKANNKKFFEQLFFVNNFCLKTNLTTMPFEFLGPIAIEHLIMKTIDQFAPELSLPEHKNNPYRYLNEFFDNFGSHLSRVQHLCEQLSKINIKFKPVVQTLLLKQATIEKELLCTIPQRKNPDQGTRQAIKI